MFLLTKMLYILNCSQLVHRCLITINFYSESEFDANHHTTKKKKNTRHSVHNIKTSTKNLKKCWLTKT